MIALNNRTSPRPTIPVSPEFLFKLQSLLKTAGIEFARVATAANGTTASLAPGETDATQTAADFRHPAIVIVRDYIELHYQEPVTLATLANETGLSATHLLRIFRDEEGVTPLAYLLRFRIAQAKKLLACGYSIVEAALLTGFYDQSHFTNTFRKLTGITPGRYQRDSKIFQDRDS